MPVYNSNNENSNPYLLIHSYALYRGENLYRNPSGKPLPMKLALLYEEKYIADPKIFYCPSNLLDLYKFESYNNPKPWGSLPQNYNTEDAQGESHNQWIRMGYTYLPIDLKKPVNNATRMPDETAKSIDDLDTYIPYMTDIIRHKEHLSHRKNGSYAVNSLFKDGHVTLCTDEKVFNNSVWDQIESGALPELTANYIVFQLIGGKGTASGW
jgi:hypothetical protein